MTSKLQSFCRQLVRAIRGGQKSKKYINKNWEQTQAQSSFSYGLQPEWDRVAGCSRCWE